jgi:hypothetical protein
MLLAMVMLNMLLVELLTPSSLRILPWTWLTTYTQLGIDIAGTNRRMHPTIIRLEFQRFVVSTIGWKHR